ncbi:polyhydroxyalkanoate depolymerase [Tardiphaga sp. vice352]|uniref:polyhydroxyalkanoate depolymerase n=1 Tax=unclassified Tardiphaga TaxID=2631404 RepID=UPI0011641CE0|nr:MULTISPECIES: polyhydroxyalkanoate depolymerase [unclassified Tardiphaga]QDM16211.1 polyhydroxyalkanoate depolymerase [Tardiphaga sp. vice278]QDM21236.1 polyhydroxyalkanoate depolymerase [Tardiphaga sp. vice154]QDM26418.1 polyhydroxyalkanoate depolymerase [Tardiphaga sp. vice304]QDM31486.1 polyhydroxyalkanoate depolymerase [Tardiphaga sp. vice352]
MMSMMYQAYQNHMDLTAPWRTGAAQALKYINLVPAGTSDKVFGRLSAALELVSRTALTYVRPEFAIGPVPVGNSLLDVVEEVVFSTAFGSLLHFKKEGSPLQPKLLLVAPMSGHFATLLRGTVATLLQDHDVYITDWHNPRDIPLSAGKFGLDDYTEHLILFMNELGPRSHMVAICQPSVSALAAAAIMSEDDHPARPASLTLMAGPIDTRIAPTKVNDFAKSKPLKWFEDNLINYVPLQCKGAFRKVYPGFIQLTAFVSMNLERHIKSHVDLANHLAKGETEKAEIIKTFYDEYFAVMDLTAEFYIETIRDVFQEHLLPQGKMMYKGRPVNPGAIRRMGLMTVEGEKDDICSIGQTLAAQDLCTGVRAYRKVHHMQAGVGHYGVFSGRRWNNEIYPLLRDFVHVNS